VDARQPCAESRIHFEKKVTALNAESMSLPLPLKFPRLHSVSVETEVEAGLQPKYAWVHASYFK
jgi:hypothetical protein